MSIDPRWREDAACRYVDPELFFPDVGGNAYAAKRICNGWVKDNGQVKVPPCGVRAECLAYALAVDERHGIYGGLSPNERQPLRKGAA